MNFKKLVKADFDANKENLRFDAISDFVNALTSSYLKYKFEGLSKEELASILEEAQVRLEEL